MTAKWDKALRVAGIGGLLLAYGIFAAKGTDVQVFLVVVMAIGTLVMPEFVDKLPFGPSK